jgi:hypothetical protein
MTGSLLISLDCEGKWGFADDPSIIDSEAIVDRNLRDAYDFLFRSLDHHQLRATFAVVGLFAAGRERAEHHIQSVGEEPGYRRWLEVPRRAMSIGRTEGWFFEELPQKVIASGRHELASHGYSHIPFGFPGASRETARHELGEMQSISNEHSWGIDSMVYPRNDVAHTEILREYGILRHRTSTEPVSFYERMRGLVGEFNVGTTSDPTPGASGAISPGRFLNWRAGPRRLVPAKVTALRWRRICEHAMRSGGCAHIWFHPHNVVTGRHQRELVEEVLKISGDFVRRDELKTLTFKDVPC